MIPVSLQYPANPLNISRCWVQLSEELFGELSDALKSPASPAAAVLLAEFEKWQQFVPVPGPNVVDKSTVASWLAAYAVALEQRETANDTYTSSVARLLRGRSTMTAVPFVVAWQNKSAAQVLKLEMVSVSAGAGGFWLHPSFAHRSADMQAETGQFLTAITGAWASACSQCPQPVTVDVFWRLTTDDGGALPAIQLDGPSASAAALRAFWHITRALKIDPDVYVLADAMSSNGRIEAVGQLRGKINCIQATQSVRKAGPPTLVAAQRLSDDDLAAIRGASDWAEVVQVATVEELIAVRSCTTSSVIAYMEHLAEKLDETPWTRDGKPVRLSDVHVPPQVWRDEYSFHSVAEDEPRGEQRDWRPAGYDPANADREVAPRLKQQRRKILVPWKAEFARPQHQPIVIVGGPGFGKTSLLRWTAREIVLESLATLHARTKAWSEVRWPIISDLAAWLSRGGDPHDALRDSALDFAPLPKTHPKLQRETLPHVVETRLIAQTENTYLFLDALDQVPVSQLHILRGRLGDLRSIAPRLLFSTREAGLSTHLPNTSFPRLTILEAAALSTEGARALAAKWLNSDLATRLEADLRAQAAMSVVADSPLLLTLACGIVARAPNGELPETAPYLYRDLMQSLARGEWRGARSETDGVHDPDALLARLRPMAWRLFSREAAANRFTRDTLIRALNGGSSSPDTKADTMLGQLCHLGFLEGSGQSDGEPHFQFRHTTFLEFLAAAHFAAEINAEGWAQAQVRHWDSENGWHSTNVSQVLEIRAFDPAWEPLFAFTSGLMKQPKPLLDALADPKNDDIYRYRLGLLCRCYGSLATDKENGLEELVVKILPMIERMSRNARSLHAGRMKSWLRAADFLLNLPKAGRHIIKFFGRSGDQQCSGCLAVKLSKQALRHESAKLLFRSAQNMRSGAGMEALLVLLECEAYSGMGGGDDQTAIELAERWRWPHFIERLEQMMDAASEKPYVQANLAEALLRVSDARIARKAFDHLVALVENGSIDGRCRSQALNALVKTLDTPLEVQGAAVIIPHLTNSSRGALSEEQRGLMHTIVFAAREYRSKTTFALLQCSILYIDPNAEFLCRQLGTSLILWDDPTAKYLGIELLLKQVDNDKIRCYSRVESAKLLLEHGDDAVRAKAFAALDRIAKAPITHEDFEDSRILAVKALLNAGKIYDDEIRNFLRELGMADGSRADWVVDAAKIAKEHHDTALVEILMVRLRGILNRHFNPQSYENRYENLRGAAKLFLGTTDWDSLEKNALARLRGFTERDKKESSFSNDVVRFGAKSSVLMKLAEESLGSGKRTFCRWAPLIRELILRGWRFQILHRKIVILRRGQEEPRANANFGD